jgi:hypothetical protein
LAQIIMVLLRDGIDLIIEKLTISVHQRVGLYCLYASVMTNLGHLDRNGFWKRMNGTRK